MLAFLHDGCVEMDSNFVENRIRPIKLTAKNALFAGHDEGARSWGRIASLIETYKMNGVEPYAWLKTTLEKIATLAIPTAASTNSCPSSPRQTESWVLRPNRLRSMAFLMPAI